VIPGLLVLWRVSLSVNRVETLAFQASSFQHHNGATLGNRHCHYGHYLHGYEERSMSSVIELLLIH
jgi:hypothetical protein